MFSSNTPQPAVSAYIEDVFSTWLYTGTGASQSISNGVDLSANAGMVWIKSRSATTDNFLFDTARGVNSEINSNTTDASTTLANSLTAFNTNGFTVGSATGIGTSSATYASWTFREQPKFFDVVTYTGNGVPGRQIDHLLGSVPGSVILKATSTTGDWLVNHRSVTSGDLDLNSTAAATGTVNTITLPVSSPGIVGNSNGVFLAYTAGSTTYYTSTNNGASWTTRTFPSSAYAAFGVTSAGQYFYATRTAVPWTAAYSSDGVTWTQVTGIAGSPSHAAYNQNSGGYMIYSGTTGLLYFSSNGTSFSSVSTPSVTGSGVRLAALTASSSWLFGNSFTASTSSYYTSSDNGASWTTRSYPSSQSWSFSGTNGYVIRGYSTSNFSFTTDGINWTSFNGGGVASSIFSALRYLNGWFFFLDGNSRFFATNLESTVQISSSTSTVAGATNSYVMYRTAAGTTGFTTDTGGQQVTSITSTKFSPGIDYNINGVTYVAYLFAHNAGGFGVYGADNVITCGSYTGNGSAAGPIVTLGYEPQWLMIKNASGTGSWQIIDNMRGMPVGSADATLQANSPAAESSVEYLSPNATGFQITSTSTEVNTNTSTYIYIAIRRGPMKTPTVGTSVFGPSARTGTGANATVTGGQTDDAVLIKNRGSAVVGLFSSRLTNTGYLETSSTNQEVAAGTTILQANPWDVMDGVKLGTTSTVTNGSANTYINYLFRRAPGFFDVVCYTGTGATNNVSHNLTVAPELIICKTRSTTANWGVGYISGGLGGLRLNGTAAAYYTGISTSIATATSFDSNQIYDYGGTTQNSASITYVAYLFSTVAGVSKVGSYTGTGTTNQINCGFTGGARFVLIKRTDSTGDWYVWDSARGIVAGNDPYLLLNSTAAEVTSTDYVDTYSAGFELSSTAPAAINANGGTFIFWAVA
jgi:hypothetical protein